jgi:nicotinamide mononucleotide (NMN) deamidase PncC
MPLEQGNSDQAVSNNIKAEMAAGRPQKQAVAIALPVVGRAKPVGLKKEKPVAGRKPPPPAG